MTNQTIDIGILLDRVEALEQKLSNVENQPLLAVLENSDATSWLYMLLSAFNIFLMQAGFALLEVGTVQAKNAKSILFKNTLDATVSMMVWWCVGFGLAGNGASCQTGRNFFFVADINTLSFIHSYVFAGTTATIVSGGVAERMNFSAYVVFSMFMVGLVYPVLVLWCWSSAGWVNQLGYKDFAGSGVIHLCGGVAALLGATLLGPRAGRFKVDKEKGLVEVIDIKGHSPVLSNFGTFILLFGWLSFNGSSVLGGKTSDLMIASRAVLNTFLSASSCALTSFAWRSFKSRIKENTVHTHNLEELNNSILAGAVAITGSCAYVEGWSAVIIGCFGYFIYKKSANFIMSLHVDDPLEASAVHGFCGLWGVLAVGIFGHPKYVEHPGIVFGCGKLLGTQILSVLIIVSWTAGVCLVLYKVIDQIPGLNLRVDKDSELLGLDFAYHDGFAYPDLNSDAIKQHNEIKAAERRAEARHKGIKVERKKVKDLKTGSSKRRRKKIIVDGKEESVSASDCSQSLGRESAWTNNFSIGSGAKNILHAVGFRRAGPRSWDRNSFESHNISVKGSDYGSDYVPSHRSCSENGDENMVLNHDKKGQTELDLDLAVIEEGKQHRQDEEEEHRPGEQ